MEDVMVAEGAILGENLLARAPGRDGLQNPVQLLPRLFWWRAHLRMSVYVLLMAALMMPKDWRPGGREWTALRVIQGFLACTFGIWEGRALHPGGISTRNGRATSWGREAFIGGFRQLALWVAWLSVS